VEGRSKSEFARDYGVSRRRVIPHVQWSLADGDASLAPRSRRPVTARRTAFPSVATSHSGAPNHLLRAHLLVATTCLTSAMYLSAAASASSGVLPCSRALR
jgi:hypothetical protein